VLVVLVVAVGEFLFGPGRAHAERAGRDAHELHPQGIRDALPWRVQGAPFDEVLIVGDLQGVADRVHIAQLPLLGRLEQGTQSGAGQCVVADFQPSEVREQRGSLESLRGGIRDLVVREIENSNLPQVRAGQQVRQQVVGQLQAGQRQGRDQLQHFQAREPTQLARVRDPQALDQGGFGAGGQFGLERRAVQRLARDPDATQASDKFDVLAELGQFTQPPGPVAGKLLVLLIDQLLAFLPVGHPAGEAALEPDEGGAFQLALIFQPVGQDEAGRKVIGLPGTAV
jgi:hypothetical protein